MTNQPSAPGGQVTQIQIADNIPGAEYTNIMQINHTAEEFTMIFANVVGTSGKVVSKVITSPGHMKRIVDALADNIKKYEEQFGAIKTATAPEAEKGMGFGEKK